jgi:EamA domain-containing membrane protein RarD
VLIFFTGSSIKTSRLVPWGLLSNDVFYIWIHSDFVLQKRNAVEKVNLQKFCSITTNLFSENWCFFLFARGAELGSIGMVSVGATAYPVIPIIGGVLLFKERLIYTQVIGINLLLLSLVVLAVT